MKIINNFSSSFGKKCAFFILTILFIIIFINEFGPKNLRVSEIKAQGHEFKIESQSQGDQSQQQNQPINDPIYGEPINDNEPIYEELEIQTQNLQSPPQPQDPPQFITAITSEKRQVTVCPAGTPGQNGCDYIGGDGIQQAVDQARNNPRFLTIIFIKNGTYTRNNYTEMVIDMDTSQFSKKRKCFIYTREKSLSFVGESRDRVILDGKNSSNMTGFCAKGGNFEVTRITFRGFKADPQDCYKNLNNACSPGHGFLLVNNAKGLIKKNAIIKNQGEGIRQREATNFVIENNFIYSNRNGGIYLLHYSKALISENEIISNQNYGIRLLNFSEAEIKRNKIVLNRTNGINLSNSSKIILRNNLIFNNEGSGIYFDKLSRAEIINNTISLNKLMGLNIFSCNSDNDPSVVVKNNIITHNGRFGIGGLCINQDEKLKNDKFSYNLIWENKQDNTSCSKEEFCTNFQGRINVDPQFADLERRDFRLKSNSPGIDKGDPDFRDRDGSRSDLGPWGGQNPLPDVINGDFESDWEGWQKNDIGEQEIVKETNDNKVLYQLNDNPGSRIIQWVPLKGRSKYEITLDLRGTGNKGDGPVAMADEWCLGGNKGNSFIKGTRFTYFSDWSRKTAIFRSGSCEPDQDHRLAIYFDTNENFQGKILVDNVNLNSICSSSDCNQKLDENDFISWKCEFLGRGICKEPLSNRSADFNFDNAVNLIDFEIWRRVTMN